MTTRFPYMLAGNDGGNIALMRIEAARRFDLGLVRWVGVALACTVLSGCLASPSPKNDYELQTLLQEYETRSAQIEGQHQQKLYASIKRVDVARRPDGSGYVVSVDLEGAPVPLVVNQILTRTGSAYDMSDIQLGGTVTARFERLPLVEAVNQLVNPHGVSVSQRKGILVFRRGVVATPDTSIAQATSKDGGKGAAESETAKIYQVVPLRNLKTADASTLLKGLYNFENEDNPAISIGELPESNSLYIGGQPRDVANAVAVLRQADQDIPHVLIEAFVVEYNVDALENIGIQLNDATIGDFTGINLIPAQTASNIVFTFLDGLSDPTQLTAIIDALVSVDKAEVLSRPYLATQSNQQAKIQVVTERFVAIQRNENGADVTTTEPIEAGVTLDVTPTVLADGTIRLNMQVEESEFEEAVGAAIVQKGRSSTQTSMTVASGQTIVVGGLNRRRYTAGNAGLPKLRRIPLLGLLFSKESSVDRNVEVVVYLTPYVWRPSMGLPIPRPDLPSARQSDQSDLELRLGHKH